MLLEHWPNYLSEDPLTVALPVTHVALKIKMKGNQVPRRLLNMSRLLLIARATRKKSTITTKEMKITPVVRGVV